jgi:hypothetical protein
MDPDELVNAASRLSKSAVAVGTAVIFSAFAQPSADLIGWQGILWGTPKAVALKTLQPFHIYECAATSKACAPDELIINAYAFNDVSYEVELFFAPKFGLNRVTMTADDDHFRDTLADLIRRFGKPGLESEYDSAHETTSTQWTWVTAHGKLTLASDGADGTLRINCESRLLGD